MKKILPLLLLLAIFGGCDKYSGPLYPSEDIPVSATVHGQVAIDGVGLANVDVNLSFIGMGSLRTRTDQYGKYSFNIHRIGDCIVSINNPDANLYSFARSSKALEVLPESNNEVNFTGTYIGGDGGSVPQPPVVNSTVHGRVTVDGVGLDNVTVMISLNGFYSTKTSDGGYYTFTGLGAGNHVVFLVNPNPSLYSFETVSETVTIKTTNNYEVNFSGTYIGVVLPPNEPVPQPPTVTKAIIAGVVYQDDDRDGWYGAGEIVLSGVTISLEDLESHEVMFTVTDSNGRYAFHNLLKGKYNVTAVGFESSRSKAVSIFDDNGTVFYVDFDAISAGPKLLVSSATWRHFYGSSLTQ